MIGCLVFVAAVVVNGVDGVDRMYRKREMVFRGGISSSVQCRRSFLLLSFGDRFHDDWKLTVCTRLRAIQVGVVRVDDKLIGRQPSNETARAFFSPSLHFLT